MPRFIRWSSPSHPEGFQQSGGHYTEETSCRCNGGNDTCSGTFP